MTDVKQELINLPRGGFLLETCEGAIQFGAPPETIKDTMLMPVGVPQIFVLPKDFFHLEMGISVAEIEFPIYFNFFIKQRKSKIICRTELLDDVKIAFEEAVFGPKTLDLSGEYKDEHSKKSMPDLKKEMDYFRRGLKLSDLVEFIPIEKGKVQLGKIKIIMDKKDGHFEVHDNGELLAEVPGTIQFNVKYDVGETSSKRFIPPRMGVTCLGPSHGFDPLQNTSGFILWLNSRGAMIDPPVASTEWLQKSNVNPKYIDSIILTHCHSDHDAGTFQKILAEEKVNIYTSHTVMNSFLKKYSSLTQIPREQLLEMFNFYPVTIGEPIMIHQGLFSFFYTLHSIPTIGFKVNFRGKTFVYSSDHLNEPAYIDQMFSEGVFSEGRRDFLKNFPWDSDLIYHEAGIPPLHTPVAYLQTLPDAVQKKTVVYHIAEKDFPKENHHLTLAKFGIENTRVVDIPKFPYDQACDILNMLEKVEYFNAFSLSKISELLSVLGKKEFSKGETIIQKGTPGDMFYIITSGKVTIEGLSANKIKQFGEYDTFGEASLLLGEPRLATIVAETDVEAITIDKNDFLNLVKGTKLEKKLVKLSQSRNAETWDTLSQSPMFKNTTSFQKTAFEMILQPYNSKKGETLIKQNDKIEKMFLIQTGLVHQINEKNEIRELSRGDFVGDIVTLQKSIPSKKTYKVKENSKLYEINRDDMLEYIETYPNIYMNLIYNG